jgi:outer membrane protein assembly factor BamB
MLLFSSIVSASEGEGQWPMLNSDPAHTGVSKYNVSTYPPRVLWKVEPLGSIAVGDFGGMDMISISSSRPVIGPDGNIIVVQTSGNISAVDPDGEIVWRSNIPGHINRCTPAIGADGTIYLGAMTVPAKGLSVLAISKDGTLMWDHELNDTWNTPQSISIDHDGTLYCTCTSFFLNRSNPLDFRFIKEGIVFALNPSGMMLWSSHIPSPPLSSPALANDGSIYVHAYDGLYAFARNGSQRWAIPLEEDTFPKHSEVVTTQNSSAVLVHNETLLSVSSDGNIEWQSEGHFGSWFLDTPLAYYEHTLIIVDGQGQGISFYTENGTLRGNFSSMDFFGVPKAAVSNNGLIIVFNGPALIAFGIDGQEVWRIETGFLTVVSAGQDSPIIGEDGRIYLLINEGTDYMSLVAYGENATILDGGPWSVYLLPLIVVLMAITVWLATRKKGKRT